MPLSWYSKFAIQWRDQNPDPIANVMGRKYGASSMGRDSDVSDLNLHADGVRHD